MNTHPYLRAYMAGSVLPTMVTLIVLTGFVLARFVFGIPVPIERVIVFPMAVVPNLFGAWNMLYLSLKGRRHLPIGLHGAVLPFLLAPLGYAVASGLGFLTPTHEGLVWFDTVRVSYAELGIVFCVALVVYYLVWKYAVNFFNETLGIA
jgi:hypothetical protein